MTDVLPAPNASAGGGQAAPPAPRVLPPLDDTNRPFWTGGAAGVLLIGRCADCRRWTHPPIESCPECGGPVAPEPVSGAGTVFTFTVNHHAFHPAVPVPYVIAIVELAEQPDLRLVTNIVDCPPEAVHIGMPVQVAFEPNGEAFVPVFRPAG
ncbi:MAG: OB-fold domain-containing protein [Frankia sp.]|nr:OB-fold domain-containing protein [Frankia sp.]